MESGKYIDGRYKIKHILGSGGMANVFLATDLILERDVAIKVLRYDFKDDKQSIRRFHREATASTELVHPNIVPIYDIGGDEYPYIVMEYVEGPNLMEYINANHPIAYRKAIAIMQEILSGVAYAHSKGVIHRDLKPQNILMNKKGQAMITDFGIAVALTQQSITQTNSVLGSVQYIAPEQAKGSIASNESDIYSLGIILYQLLTNQLPFDGESAVSIALMHFQEPMPSIRELDPNIPQALENVVLKATAKDPQQRYSSANEMAEDLRTSISPERYNETMFVESSENLDKVNTIPLMSNSKMATASVSAENKDETPSKAAVIIDDNEEDQTNSKVDKASEKDEKPKRKRPWIWIIVIILLALLVIFGGIYYASLPADVSVPDLEGMMYEEVESVLSENELEIGDKIDEPSEEYEENMVIRSNPSSGDTIKEGTAVDVYVSTGDPFVDFPDVIGENYDEIRAALTEQGFTVEREDTQSSEYGVGDITDQSIAEGTEVRPSNTTVTLTVSTGLPTFSLRDLSNLTLESVENYANEMGLSVTSSTAYHDTVPAGQVISQSPEASETVTVGDEISVVISDGPEDTTDTLTVGVTIPYLNTTESEEETTTSSSEESSDDGSSSESSSEETETITSELVPNDVVIYIEDATHSLDEPYRTLRITNDTTVQLEFNLEQGQSGRYRIERNGSIIEESVITN